MQIACVLLFVLLTGFCNAKNNHNSKPRAANIDAIILHAIAGPYCVGGSVKYSDARDDLLFWKKFFEKHKVIGIHYIIGRNGDVVKSIDEGKVANHAIGWNHRSIGIELLNQGDGIEGYPKSQMLSLQLLITQLKDKYPLIKIKNILRHSDIDHRSFKCGIDTVKQKQDPGLLFDYPGFLHQIKN